MASINTLPIELLHKIIDLTVEDAIALKGDDYIEAHEEQLRRNILIPLALVSKDFTRPAQLALWRYMNLDDMGEVEDLIAAGFGSDKVIEELNIWINTNNPDGLERFNKLISFLRGVKKVMSITNMIIHGSVLPLDEFFEIDSIQELKSIEFHDYHATKILLSPQTRLSSHLRHLTINRFSKRADDIVSRLIESSSSTLVSIKLFRIKSSQYSRSTLSSVLALLGPKLQKLDVTESYNTLIVSSLLPHCTSLKSLNLYSDFAVNSETFNSIVKTLATIPPSVIFESFCITLPPPSKLVDFPAFVQLLQTSPFSQLQRLKICPNIILDDRFQELVEFVRENDEFMELLENRGIILEFGTEEEVRLKAEKEKQRLYQERQDKLDLGSKEEEKEGAESKE